MKQELWRRAEDLFHAALERLPEARRAFLDEACGEDTRLRQQVEMLVSNDEHAGSFLENPVLADVTATLSGRGALVGRQYGSYRLLSLLGAGGMGEVYRAHDRKLGRDVAIKTLPPEFARDPKRLARFRREARTLASLNHPNIAAIYGLEESADVPYLVLELAEGDTLRGPLPLAPALDRACQVAEALEAAHEHGIIHRDLKPANVKVTSHGRVKVLDFGLAKAIWATESTPDPPHPMTGTGVGTVTGVVLGTPGYMSPEQARGAEVDQRTDIWAFGCLLYELLAGRRAFESETVSDTAASLLEHEPDWQALPAETPAKVRALLRQCLHKDAKRRLNSIAEARATLEEVQRGAAVLLPPSPGRRGARATSEGRAATIASLAVLPFANLSANPDDEFLSDGIADDLLTALSRLPGLRVPGRTSCFALKGKTEDLRKVGQMLRVETVLEGSVRRAGSRLQIAVQLINVVDGCHIWSERYDLEMADILAVQDEITQAIMAALMPTLAADRPGTLIKQYTGSVDAYELCLRARYHHQRRTADGLGMALRLFEQAAARDPNCALAYAGIAHVCLILSYFGGLPTSEGMPRMKVAALRALELDDTLAVAHVRLADALCFKDWDWAGAEQEFLQALALDPDSSEALCRYGLFLWARQRHAEALVQLRKALEVDPFSLDANWFLGWVYLSLSQLDQAEEVARKMLSMDPSLWIGYHVRSAAKWVKGLWAEAIQDTEKMAAIEGGPATLGALCYVYARAGKAAEARRTLERLEQMTTERIVPPTWLALAYDAVADTAQAGAWMERAFEQRHMLLVHLRGWMASVGWLSGYRTLLDEHGL
jgi:serine/threonine-protein kinase